MSIRKKPVVYLASPLGFSLTARAHLLPLFIRQLEAAGVDVYEPFSTNEQNGLGPFPCRPDNLQDWAFDIAQADRDGVRSCDAIFAIINGLPPDEGVAVELGIAIALNKPTFLFRDDFRKAGDSQGLDCNLMLYSGLPRLGWEKYVYKTIEDITSPSMQLVQWVKQFTEEQ